MASLVPRPFSYTKSVRTCPLNPICSHRQGNRSLALTTSNRAEGARLDVAANGFWGGCYERALFDVQVLNPYAPSYRHTLLPALYRQQENTKKRAYEQRVLEFEHALFTPLVMSLTGGLSKAANSTYKRLASLLTTGNPVTVRSWVGHSSAPPSCVFVEHAKPLLSVDLMTAVTRRNCTLKSFLILPCL